MPGSMIIPSMIRQFIFFRGATDQVWQHSVDTLDKGPQIDTEEQGSKRLELEGAKQSHQY